MKSLWIAPWFSSSADVELVDEHVDVPDRLEAEALEDRPRHRAALRDQRRRPAGGGLVPARPQQRAVGAAAAGTGGVAPP